MSYLPVAFFVLGFLLILTEVFVPGFGVFGIVGTGCLLFGIYLLEDDLSVALLEMAIVVVVLAIAVPFSIRYIARRRGFGKLGLNQSLTTEEGFTSRKSGLEYYLGKSGQALTDLRPGGTIVLDDDTRLDVVTRGDYISKGTKVEVVSVDGTWLIVRAISSVE